MSKTISVNEWIAELAKLDKRKTVMGLTTGEIAAQTGRCVGGVRDMVRKAVAAGLCEFAGYRMVDDISGRGVAVPQYRFKKAKKGGGPQ